MSNSIIKTGYINCSEAAAVMLVDDNFTLRLLNVHAGTGCFVRGSRAAVNYWYSLLVPRADGTLTIVEGV